MGVGMRELTAEELHLVSGGDDGGDGGGDDSGGGYGDAGGYGESGGYGSEEDGGNGFMDCGLDPNSVAAGRAENNNGVSLGDIGFDFGGQLGAAAGLSAAASMGAQGNGWGDDPLSPGFNCC